MRKWCEAAMSEMSARKKLTEAIGMAMVASTGRRFEGGVDPEGKPWEPSSGPGQTLIQGGHLRDSVTYEASSEQVVWGSNRKYAAIHQHGGEIVPKTAKKLMFKVGGKTAAADRVTIPQRAYLGVNEEDREEVEALMKDFLEQALGGGKS
ncbi:MAG: phage virion morphogenesis protein [Tenuifilaceae bacterium]|nr:phage virion morphogenesis protein [Tenuifilaceae bacterium]